MARAAILVAALLAIQLDAAAAPPEVHVDPRVELMATVFRLAGSREYSAGKSAYIDAVKARFGKLAGHPAVAAVKALQQSHFIYFDAPMRLAMYLDPQTLAPLRPLSPPPPGLDPRWNGAPIDDFLSKLRDFEKVSGFRAFFAEQAAYYAGVEERFRALAEKYELRAWADAYYGPRPGIRAVVVPGPQDGTDNYGVSVTLPDGAEVHYQILALGRLDEDGLPVLGEDTLALWAHESSHPYCNPLIEGRRQELGAAGERLYAPVAERMRAQHYASAETMLSEALVRASVILYLRERLGAQAAAHEGREQDLRGFYFVEELAATIDEARRRRHQTLEQVMPEVVAYLRAAADKVRKEGLPKRPFRGPINLAFKAPEPPTYVAAPALVEKIRSVKAGFNEEAAPLLAADKATWKDVPHAAMLYGTPATNKLLAELLARHREQVGPDRVVVDGKTFEGHDLLLITSHPNPGDAMRGVVVYAAASDEVAGEGNHATHGPTDWVVARRVAGGGFEVVGKGDHPVP